MSLREDQRALLQLLLGGDDYEQVAAVLGASASEVRSRAREAAADLEEADAGEEGFAEAVRERLAELEDPGAAPVRSPGTQPAGRRGPSPLAWIGIGGVLAAALIVFVITQTGDDSESATKAPPADQEDVVAIKLTPVGGAKASGTASLVRVADVPAVDIEVSGLEPTGPGETYVLWLLGSGDQGIPIAFRDVGPDGRFSGRTQIPSAASGLLPNVDVIDLSLAREREVSAAVSSAAEGGALPSHVGTTVVRGALRG